MRTLPLLEGRRYDLFDKDALALLVEGRLAFTVRGGTMVMSAVEPV